MRLLLITLLLLTSAYLADLTALVHLVHNYIT
jgi:hypothetical protein